MRKKLFGAGLLLGALVFLGVGCGSVDPTLTLNKTTFEPGETIPVIFTASGDYETNAWVGIIPSDIEHGDEATNDQHDLSYKYLDGQTSGNLEFTAPTEPGSYDLRMHDTDSGGTEVASVTFTVAGDDSSETADDDSSDDADDDAADDTADDEAEIEPDLELDAETYAPGDDVVVTYTSPGYENSPWIGVIPSDVEHGDEATNDENDLSFHYITGETSGEHTFTAPDEPGEYDIRMHDTDAGGDEVASVTFTVE